MITQNSSKSHNQLAIIYLDDDLVVINKPHGLLVHPSPLARDAEEFALQKLRDQLGQYVYPAHRLDRKTAGLLVFALHKEVLSQLKQQFAKQEVKKVYHAILRGFSDDHGTIDYPLKKENGQMQEAVTHYDTLKKTEIELPFGNHSTSRYSLVAARPETGRMHQLRKHFAHILHPIIGDRPHGCNKQNKLFKEKWQMTTMMLHARALRFVHPVKNIVLNLEAPYQAEFKRTLQLLEFDRTI